MDRVYADALDLARAGPLVTMQSRVPPDLVPTKWLFGVREHIMGFDAAPDGQSFLLSVWTPGPTDGGIHVVTGSIPRSTCSFLGAGGPAPLH
jgi:hypothetical protein